MCSKSTGIVTLLLAALILTGCTYSYDFALEGDLVSSNGAEWAVLTGGLPSFNANGAYLDNIAIKAPYKFSGDYTVEYKFWPIYSGGSFISKMGFYLADTDHMGMFVYNFPDYAPGTVRYAIEWSPDGHFGANANPFIVENSENTLVIQKRGDRMIFTVNSTFVAEAIIPAYLMSSNWAPVIWGEYSGNSPSDGLYIRRVKVTYQYGNMHGL